MLNIVIPMAGRGSRFADVGYQLPKPLIDVKGRTMINVVIDNLRPKTLHRFIFICQSSHLTNFPLEKVLREAALESEIIEVSSITDGAACTVLLAKRLIDSDDELMIANCDQYLDLNINEYIKFTRTQRTEGCILTMKSNESKWSYIKFDTDKKILGVVEKEVVSDEATVGVYNFRKGREFVQAAEKMIESNERVNDEFYVAPVYNRLLDKGSLISYVNVSAFNGKMFGLGTPKDLEEFLKTS